MATIRQRGKNSYEISVSVSSKLTDTRTRPILTVHRDPLLSEKEWEIKLQSIAKDFEDKVKNGSEINGHTTSFKQFTDHWLSEHAEKKLAPKTVLEYKRYLDRVNRAIGHIKIANITPLHLNALYNNLSEPGIRKDILYSATDNFLDYLSIHGIDAKKLSIVAQINLHTAKKVFAKSKTNSAPLICTKLNLPIKDCFNIIGDEKPLCGLTILHYHQMIKSILGKAVKWGIIKTNPAVNAEAPKVIKNKIKYFDEDEIIRLLMLLEKEHIKHKAWIYTAFFSGCRLGELGGIRISDLDFNSKTLEIRQAIQSLPGRPTLIKEPKNESSSRSVALPDVALIVLKEYVEWHEELRKSMGNQWHETDLLFTQDNGKTMYASTPTQWFKEFRTKNGLANVTFHGLRHTNVSVLLANNVDIQTIAGRIGHADASTTTKVYSHMLDSANRAAAAVFDEKYK